MRNMTEAQRLAAIKWAAETRLRLDTLRSERYSKLRDRLVVDSVNDCQSEAAETKGCE